jgi:hypothetical protein
MSRLGRNSDGRERKRPLDWWIMEDKLVRHVPKRCRGLLTLLAVIILSSGLGTSWAQGQRSEMEILKRELEELRRRDEENRRKIEELQRKMDNIQAAPPPVERPMPPEKALEKAIQDLPPTPASPAVPGVPAVPPRPSLISRQVGGTTFRLIDISLDVLFAVGFSTETDESLQTLQGGGHDPRKRGFTLQQAELSLSGAVDPYFNAESHIVFFIDPITGETGVELEEAFFTTQSLPYTLQLKGGFFLTELGLINPTHPHAWDWLDQPVINTRLFGADGMRQAGLRLKGLLPLPWFSELYAGVQNADGETMASFYGGEIGHSHGGGEEEHEHVNGFESGIGGRPIVQRDVKALRDLVYSTRWVNSWDLSPEVTTQLGFSGAFGPNTTGRSGYTQIYGTDFLLRWRPANHFRGWPYLAWQSEFLYRNYKAAAFTSPINGETSDDHGHDHGADNGGGEVFPAKTLADWGFYSQLIYGFRYGWAGGLRYEYATGSGESVGGRNRDPFRDNRHRLSPLLSWRPTEFSRIRLQYNYDRATHLEFDGLGNREKDAHSVWLGFEVLIGAHPAHKLY